MIDTYAKAKVFVMGSPQPRVVVDVPTARWNGKLGLPADYRGALIKGIRYGFHDAKTSRIVFDLAADVTLYDPKVSAIEGTQDYQVHFDITGNAPARPAARPGSGHTQPQPEKDSSGHSFWYRDPPQKQTESQPAPEPRNTSGKPVIVIDAGHGGQDPGTAGHTGTQEKRVTLHYAYLLRDALNRTGHYKVVLTRDDDYYLLLRDRVKRARAAHGDLFISLHADSAPSREARGLSVYTISEKASDKESELLAAKENKADVIGGMDLSDTSQDVADILIDLAQRETRAKSAKFADLAVRNLGHDVHLLSNTHRYAGFAVLKAPDIPSVLIEIGFLTSPQEEHMLQTPSYQTKVMHALVKAIDTYFGKNKK
jgi:N-acetylmuramoyl-L-alanine amidase